MELEIIIMHKKEKSTHINGSKYTEICHKATLQLKSPVFTSKNFIFIIRLIKKKLKELYTEIYNSYNIENGNNN